MIDAADSAGSIRDDVLPKPKQHQYQFWMSKHQDKYFCHLKMGDQSIYFNLDYAAQVMLRIIQQFHEICKDHPCHAPRYWVLVDDLIQYAFKLAPNMSDRSALMKLNHFFRPMEVNWASDDYFLQNGWTPFDNRTDPGKNRIQTELCRFAGEFTGKFVVATSNSDKFYYKVFVRSYYLDEPDMME